MKYKGENNRHVLTPWVVVPVVLVATEQLVRAPLTVAHAVTLPVVRDARPVRAHVLAVWAHVVAVDGPEGE
jgi:hypothetical protein